MTIVDVTKDNECCCTCTHNKRTFDKEYHCTCTCELDGHRIGYVANFESVCEEWEGSGHERGEGMIDEDTLMRIAIIYALISIIGILVLVIV